MQPFKHFEKKRNRPKKSEESEKVRTAGQSAMIRASPGDDEIKHVGNRLAVRQAKLVRSSGLESHTGKA
jgi:hypothetical protein